MLLFVIKKKKIVFSMYKMFLEGYIRAIGSLVAFKDESQVTWDRTERDFSL